MKASHFAYGHINNKGNDIKDTDTIGELPLQKFQLSPKSQQFCHNNYVHGLNRGIPNNICLF